MSESITKDHPEYAGLVKAWLAAGRPVNLSKGNKHYQCLQPSDDEVVFIPQEGFDNYASQTHIPGS